MGRTKERWADLLDAFEAWGEAEFGKELPTDEQLWNHASEREPELIPEHVDDDMLDDLRDAYRKGRKPWRLDMEAVAMHVRKAGVNAFVDMSGGNTATIYAGRQEPDDLRWPALAGPGWFEGPSWTKPFAHLDDFWVGPDDEGESEPVAPGEGATPEKVAGLIVDIVKEVEAQRRQAAQQRAISDVYKQLEQAQFRFGQLMAAVAADLVRAEFPTAATLAFHCERDGDDWTVNLVAVRDAAGEPLWNVESWLYDLPAGAGDAFEGDDAPIRDHLSSALRHGVDFPSAIDTPDADPTGQPALLRIEQALADAGGPWVQEQAAERATPNAKRSAV